MINIGFIFINNNRILRESITTIIEKQPDFNIMALFCNTKYDLNNICDLKPDILLFDLGLANPMSFQFMKYLMNKYPEVKVVAINAIPIQKDILQYIEAGVSGFILKDTTTENLLMTLRSVADEEKVLPSNMTGPLFSQIVDNETNQVKTSTLIQTVRMTKREREMVLLIADGMTNKEIAQKLHLSVYTVKNHVHTILEKMVLNAQIQYAIYAPQSEDINSTDANTTAYDE